MLKRTSFRRPATSVNVLPPVPSLGRMNTLAPWAEQLARALLHEPLPRRWAHVQGVAAQARGLAPVLGTDADLLQAAAWLHDIGYAPRPRHHRPASTRWRPVPARRPPRRCHAVPAGRPPLLRHHRSRRTRTRLHPEFRVRPCTGRTGQRADVLRHGHQPRWPARAGRHALAEINERYGPGHLMSRSIRRATPMIFEAVEQVHQRAGQTP